MQKRLVIVVQSDEGEDFDEASLKNALADAKDTVEDSELNVVSTAIEDVSQSAPVTTDENAGGDGGVDAEKAS